MILDDDESGHENHAFFSQHVWSTRQGKSHAIGRKLQLIIPGILRIWLDVDFLDANGDLEDAFGKSTVFILFYSEGYFASRNCQREIYTSIRLKKPVIVVYEGNELVLEIMKNKSSHFDEEGLVSSYLYDGEKSHFITWVKEDFYSAKALNNI